MEGHAVISADILAKYAADAALEVDGVEGLVESTLHRHKGVRISDDDGTIGVVLQLAIRWGASVPGVGAEVQRGVFDYLLRMADVRPQSIDVVVDRIGVPPS